MQLSLQSLVRKSHVWDASDQAWKFWAKSTIIIFIIITELRQIRKKT